MKKNVLLLILVFVTLNNFAQQEDSLLKNFKFRIDHYRGLNFSLGGAGNYDKQNGINIPILEYSSYNGNIGANYTTIKSTESFLQTSYASLGMGFTENKYSTSQPSVKQQNLNLHPQYTISNQWYKKGKSFFELDFNTNVNLQTYKSLYNSPNPPNKQSYNSYNVGITIGVGKGRLENIGSMQNALWLYKDLKETKKFNSDLSYEDLYGLGKAINQANNTRLLDARRRTKYILKSVDEYLQTKNLIAQPDIEYFTSLNDLLFFPIFNSRLSGTQKFIRLTPSILLTQNISTSNALTKVKSENNGKSILLSAGISSYKPLSLVRQTNYGFAAKLFYGKGDYNFKQIENGQIFNRQTYNTDIKSGGVNIFYEYALYPNTRTVVSFYAQTENGYQQIGKTSGYYNSSTANINVNYFISYHTYLTVSAGGQYNKNVNKVAYGFPIVAEGTSLFINAGINISI